MSHWRARIARWRAGREAELEPMLKGRDSCSSCGAAIGIGDTYTLVALTEEVGSISGPEVKEQYDLAIFCEDCSEKYMVWLAEGIAGSHRLFHRRL